MQPSIFRSASVNVLFALSNVAVSGVAVYQRKARTTSDLRRLPPGLAQAWPDCRPVQSSGRTFDLLWPKQRPGKYCTGLILAVVMGTVSLPILGVAVAADFLQRPVSHLYEQGVLYGPSPNDGMTMAKHGVSRGGMGPYRAAGDGAGPREVGPEALWFLPS